MTNATPKSLGYYFPAEFAPHDAIWLSWPHKEESWPGKIASIYPSYTEFVKIVSLTERVCINVVDEKMRNSANKMLQLAGVDLTKAMELNLIKKTKRDHQRHLNNPKL